MKSIIWFVLVGVSLLSFPAELETRVIFMQNTISKVDKILYEIAFSFKEGVNIESRINKVLVDLGVKASVVMGSVVEKGKSFEFSVFVEKLDRKITIRYTPLAEDLNAIVFGKAFKLETKMLFSWVNVPLDRFFA